MRTHQAPSTKHQAPRTKTSKTDQTKTMETPQDTQRAAVAHQRIVRRLARRDKRIAGLERKIQQLENALAWRTLDLESLSRNVRREVQDALCNVRMIPVHGFKRDAVITEVRHITLKKDSPESRKH
jgi:hypothetical protein